MNWKRLIRFEDESRLPQFGEPCIGTADQLDTLLRSNELFALELIGDDHFNLESTGNKIRVRKLLSIIDQGHVPVIKCIGLNYMKHGMHTTYKTLDYSQWRLTKRTSSTRSRSKTSAVSFGFRQAKDLGCWS